VLVLVSSGSPFRTVRGVVLPCSPWAGPLVWTSDHRAGGKTITLGTFVLPPRCSCGQLVRDHVMARYYEQVRPRAARRDRRAAPSARLAPLTDLGRHPP